MKPRSFLWACIASLVGTLPVRADIVGIERDGSHVVLTWEGNGILQSASAVAGPWSDDLLAVSPHQVVPGGHHQFYRVFYPEGITSLLEPPMMAFGEPVAQSALLAHELTHVVQTGHYQGFLPEVGDEVLVQFSSGEFQRTGVDLQIKGRGLDFIWARKYRSRTGPDTAQGKRWDFSYNIRIAPRGSHVDVFDGNGRRDLFLRQPDGSFVKDQFFREGRFDSNGVFTLTFADTGVWEFLPLDGQPAQGKISRSADRNGNALTFAYDGQGRLSRITDTLNRNITVAYNSDGFIETVTDFIGRQVRYAYYQNAELGGSFGDLKSIRSPMVTNTPNGNDFPAGKTTTYTYSKGFSTEALNHNLLTITDAKGQTWLENTYAATTDPTDINFDRVLNQRRGYTNEVLTLHYYSLSQTGCVCPIIGTLIGDAIGNVTEHLYDAGNRLVLLREYTGRAVPGQPVTQTQNRPMNPLRTNDPPFFETQFEWNVDSMPTRVVLPNGNSASNTYELALNPNANRRSRANLRIRRVLPGPLGADQTALVRSFEHDPRFGTERHYSFDWTDDFVIKGNCGDDGVQSGLAFVTRYVDGRSNETFYAYDERGNRTNTIHRIQTVTEQWEYNQFGQVTAYVAPDNGNGHRARFEGKYYTTGASHGYLHQVIVDAASAGLNLTTTCEYDAVGNVVRRVDPRGNDQLVTYNQIDQPVHVEDEVLVFFIGGSPTTVRYATDLFYDANDNLVRRCRSNHDETGALVPGNAYITQLMEYDILNRLVRVCAESGSFAVPLSPPKLDCAGLPASEFITTEYEYDANRNLTLVRSGEASEGRQPGNVVQFVYDERNLRFRQVSAPGQPEESIDQFDYDGNLNLRRVTKLDLPKFTAKIATEHDGYDRPLALTDAMGNVTTWHYDPNGNVVSERSDGETNDVAGAAGNVRLAETAFVYDAMDRRVRSDAAFFDPATQTSIGDGQSTMLFTYSDASRLLTETDDNNRTTRYAYDRANRLLAVTDPKTNTVTYGYDANGNVISMTQVAKSDLGNPDQTFITQFQYDALNRRVKQIDTMTNTVTFAYDSRDNTVLVTDALGFQTRSVYDGLTRQITVIQDLNTNGPSLADATDIVLRQEWDDNSRLLAQTDDNTNTTRFVYDSLNRLIRTIQADGTSNRLAYDVHDNRIVLSNANGTVVTSAYDLLNRLRTNSIAPGPGVSADTTFEFYRYDGLSRLVRAEDNDTTNTFSRDSLRNLLRETLNGRAVISTYDGEGNRLTCSYPGGRMLQIAYDAADNPVSYDEGGQNVFTRKIIGRSRWERGDFANRTSTDYFYDGVSGVPNAPGDFGVGEVARIRHQLIAAFDERTFSWDRNQNRALRTQVVPGGFTHQYSYDAADRLARTRVMHPSLGIVRDTGYNLDGAGNRTSVTNSGTPEFYTRDATLPQPADFQVNQYTTTPFDAREYDANGNLIAIDPGERTERQLIFDYRDQLVRHTNVPSGTLSTYAYDALGRRIAKTVAPSTGSPQTTRFFWSGEELIEEADGAGATVATYVYGEAPNDLIQMERGTNTFFYHSDDLGNVFALTDSRGVVVERYDYGDFGQPAFFDGSGAPVAQSAVGNPYLFQSLRFDSETGLYHSDPSWRYKFSSGQLDPQIGRFLTRGQQDGSGNGYSTSLKIIRNAEKWAVLEKGYQVQGYQVQGYSIAGNNPWSAKQKNWLVSNFEPGVPGPAGRWTLAWEDLNRNSGGAWGKVAYPLKVEEGEKGNPMGFQIISAGKDAYEHRDLYRNIWVTQGETPAVPSNQGWGKWEVSLGQVLPHAYFNPKEILITKHVPWQRSAGMAPSSIGCQTMSPAAARHRFFAIIDRTNFGGSTGLSLTTGARPSAAQATGKRMHTPIRFRAYY